MNLTERRILSGCAAEEVGDIREAVRIYEDILSFCEHSSVLINLGTIRYNQKQYKAAEQLYRRATVVAPDYPLAWFNLGNALDERDRPTEAREAYQHALDLNPRYAEAHYNLARLLESQLRHVTALRHWREYLRLDPISPSAEAARRNIRETIERSGMTLVRVA